MAGPQADELRVHPSADRFSAALDNLGYPADLDATWMAWPCRVVYHEGDTAVVARVAQLFAGTHANACQVERIQLRIVTKADRDNVWLAITAEGRQAAEALAAEVGALAGGEDAH